MTVNLFYRHQGSSRTQMLPLNVMINVMIIGQPAVTAIFRWRARLAWESTFTAMIYYNGSGVRELYLLGD